MSLEELRRKRLRWVEANRENDFDEGIGRLLKDLYPDSAHFIYELLQNAEDAKATQVRFILKEDGVEFEHNGSRLFTLEDVESITGIGVSTKKDDPTNIGKFGVGFKAVFAYTNTPEITSGKYHFRIRDLVVPDTEGLSPRALGEKETHFSFPFDNPQKLSENACAEIEENLRQLDESTLLFLSNIRKIEYLLPDSTLGFLERKETDGNQIEILVQHPKDSEPTSVFFLRFEKTVSVNDENGKPKSCRIAVAFRLEKREEDEKKSDRGRKQSPWIIQPLEPGLVSIYFPAEKETSNLRFHLHAPFASTVARDSVRDCEANNELRNHLADLIAESMPAIRDQGLLTVSFLATLPNTRDNLSSLYKPILDRLVQAFKSEDLTPMKRGGHAAADGIFRGPARLSDLISDKDLALLFGEEYSPPLWIANPPQRHQREDNFLSTLDIPEWTIKDLVSELSDQSEQITEWLSEKSDKWHGRLYSLLGDELLDDDDGFRDYSYRELFRRVPIVRLSDGTYRKGHECFFPDGEVEHDQTLPRVAKGVCSSKKTKTRKFLEAIGVREVGEAEQIEAILKQRYSKEHPKSRKKDMKRFIKFVEDKPGQANLFSSYYIFELEDGSWKKPGQVFLDSPYLDTGLSAYYESLSDDDSDRKWALSPDYKKAGIALKRIAEFAKKVGVQTKLRFEKLGVPYNHPEITHTWDRWTWLGTNEDYNIPEFKTLLADPDLSKSKLIWDTMNELPDEDEHCLRAQYRRNGSVSLQSGSSTLVWKLRSASWIPQEQDAEGKLLFVKPSEAIRDLLPSGFPFDNGAEWLKAIQFGKAERERKEEECRKEEQRTQDYQRKSRAAQEMGFSSLEVAQKLARMEKEDPERFAKHVAKWEAEGRRQESIPYDKALSEAFSAPGRGISSNGGGSRGNGGLSPNPSRRRKKTQEDIAIAIENEGKGEEQFSFTLRKKWKGKNDQVRVSLAEWYGGRCQICEKTFTQRSGEPYFEGLYLVPRTTAQWRGRVGNVLCLCAEHSAMFQFGPKEVEEDIIQQVMRLKVEAEGGDGSPTIRMKLCGEPVEIEFAEKHLIDLQEMIKKSQELEPPTSAVETK